MADLAAAGVDRVVGIVLTPAPVDHGVGRVLRPGRGGRRRRPTRRSTSPRSPRGTGPPGFARLLAGRTRAVLDGLDPAARARTAVFFTAHSLPQRVVAEGDPYPDQVAESAADIAGLLGLDADPTVTWGTAWQSAGRTADPWIGPDLLVEMDRVAAEGATAVVVCPVGFVSDHLEVLYDLDIEARDRADSLGHRLRPDPVAQRRPRVPGPAGRRRPGRRRRHDAR